MSDIVDGQTISVSGPNPGGFLKSFFCGAAVWSLEFLCGRCEIVSTVQHNEAKGWHKCPVCQTINRLDVSSYWDM